MDSHRFNFAIARLKNLDFGVTDRKPVPFGGNHPGMREHVSGNGFVIIAFRQIPTQGVIEIVDHHATVNLNRFFINHLNPVFFFFV